VTLPRASGKRRVRAGALAVLVLAACGPPPSAGAPLPPAPRLVEPADAVPADLDLVARVDLRRLRDALGGGFDTLLEQIIAQSPNGERDAATGRLVLRLLLKADTVWFGARPGLSPEQTDSVLVARGPFAALVPDAIGGEPAWRRPARLGGGVLRYERPTPPERALPAVLYVREPDLVVVGSAAEIDALELTVEQGRGGEPLRARESGILSVAARVPKIAPRLRERAPTLTRLIDGAERLSCGLDRRSDRYELELELEYEAAERARQVVDPFREVFAALSRAGLDWLGGVAVEASGAVVSARLSLDSARIERLIACRLTPGCGAGGSAPSGVLPSAPP
jgi:hypothetical protein